VREYSVPATLRVADDETLVDAVFANAARDASALAYRRRGPDRRWSDVTAGAFAAEVTAVARGLIAAGVEPGERVALLSRTRYEWTLVDYAILAVGAATVPIYETSSAEQIRWILSDSGAVAVVVETARHAALVEQVRDELVDLKVWRIEPEGDEPGAVERLVARGADVPESAVLERRKSVRADDLATLIYTSGTTGRPKGCALTHRNMQTEVRSVAELFPQLLAIKPELGGKSGRLLDDAAVFALAHEYDPEAPPATRIEQWIPPEYLPVDAPRTGFNARVAALDRIWFMAYRDDVLDALRSQQPGVWYYRFDWDELPKPFDAIFGAAHTFDLPFVFGNFGPSLYSRIMFTRANEPGRLALSQAMMKSVGAFAQKGEPNSAALPVTWPQWPGRIVFDADARQARIRTE